VRNSPIFWPVSAIFVMGFLSGTSQSVQAETYLINLPVTSGIPYRHLMTQAEGKVKDTIRHQFNQNPHLSRLQVVVTGDRQGEILPILTTTVSRAQWQTNPQVQTWTRYYNASYALIQRHDLKRNPTIVVAPNQPIITTFRSHTLPIDAPRKIHHFTEKTMQTRLSDLD
jgi:hypothetical protein